ncbi:Relaxase/Mobilisation nuclease domain-containing protein [Dyadobacter koreensis]|uniref:Relaxase/Mobilisation nuclease domain-containing protein n=1 Tax=Dyadobacter koreensis TaxID=408657 RepID=A0A1H6XZT8_9BACT|nr:relaxase/mobilization nuclease domain-containing protein [Dyadobacter koreensis]SEJ34563.1 Relaxase/Mobilisation nuclease domain-containing protein [Dyadobacter koreensis]
MIGNVNLGNYPKELLYYCYYDKLLTPEQRKQLGPDDVRGEILYIQNLSLEKLPDGRYNMDSLTSQFLGNRDKNKKLNKFVWHQSFSFPPGEKPTAEQIREISEAFAKDFGFENNQLIVFRHLDKAHEHIHIAANRINYNGKNTADHFNNYARTGKFCRKMELTLGLQVTPEMYLTDPERQKQQHTNKAILKLKELIDHNLREVRTLQELKEKLREQNYQTYLGRGIAFVNTKNGTKIKGSEIGRDYSLTNLEKRLGQQVQEELKQTEKKELKRERKRGLQVG